VIKATLNDARISLKDVFLGALPFAAIMLIILMVIIRFPVLSTYLLN
jgi:C4-dicarboxylate transporter DctM subunit